MKIVLINGKAYSGKDFLADLLKTELETHGKTVKIMSFADPLKEIIAETFLITQDELDEYKNLPGLYPVTFDKSITDFREILQRFGREGMMSVFGESVWVDLLRERAVKSKADFILVPSFRFPFEDISKFTIHIKNDELESIDSHASENSLGDFDFLWTIDNTGHKDLTRPVTLITNSLLGD